MRKRGVAVPPGTPGGVCLGLETSTKRADGEGDRRLLPRDDEWKLPQGWEEEAEARRREIDKDFLGPRVEVLDLGEPEPCGRGWWEQTVRVEINRVLSRGDLERVFAAGLAVLSEEPSG
jgi:hypothetical protein